MAGRFRSAPILARARFGRGSFQALLLAAVFVLDTLPGAADAAGAPKPCRIEVVDRQNGWPVPLVILRTTHRQVFVSDNAGVIALDSPELIGREVWFDVEGHGYGVPKDGFGFRGVRLTPERGRTIRVPVDRANLAKRLGRLTGSGRFAEREQCEEATGGAGPDREDQGVFGCDSVQLATYRGRLFWAWGDTQVPRYPLGVFDMLGATTPLRPLASFQPPVTIPFEIFKDASGRPRGIAKMPGPGPTWLGGYVSLADARGVERLGASYIKVRNHLEAYEAGLCVWDDERAEFQRMRVLWKKDDPGSSRRQPPTPDGHVARWKDDDGRDWLLFGNPFPVLRCRATFEAWQDPAQWESLEPPKTLVIAAGGASPPAPAVGEPKAVVRPHTGSIAWNPFRKRWVTVFMEAKGTPSAFGELWYAEARSPLGPWGPAIKILTHANYTFYNPRVHPELVPDSASFLLFEGTYTQEFADRPNPTPRYDYNQILYRLDLDEPALDPARVP